MLVIHFISTKYGRDKIYKPFSKRIQTENPVMTLSKYLYYTDTVTHKLVAKQLIWAIAERKERQLPEATTIYENIHSSFLCINVISTLIFCISRVDRI